MMTRVRMARRARSSARRLSLVMAALLTAGVGVVALSGPSSADHMTVTQVEGSAYGYFASVSLFGGPPGVRGPSPAVTLAPDASNSPQSATQATGLVQFGPAILFSSGPLNVTTVGTTGPGGSVTSTATVGPVNTSQQEVFTAANLSSTCTANEAGVTGSTTVTGGTLVVSEGNPDVEGDETIVQIPVNPDPNTTYNGVIEGVGDSFRAVFNEQIVDPADGSLTVNAYHLYLLGPTAVGELIVGQVVCGVATQLSPTTTTTVAPTTTTTVAPTTTTTVAPGNLPTSKDQCKKGGYANFGFRNQGQCVSFVVRNINGQNVASVRDANAGGGVLILVAIVLGLMAVARPRRG